MGAFRKRHLAAVLVGLMASLVVASSALAGDCTNASKSSPTAGAQVVLNFEGDILWVSNGLLHRIEQGLVDPETGEGFHGILAFDIDGDGVADLSTWAGVGPDGEEIPIQAQLRGPACKGLTNIGIYLTQCVGG